MAYKFSKGNREFGDIMFEDDSDTGIDFETDTVKIETGGAERLVVTNSDITLTGDVIIDQYIKHNGDVNTKMNFTDDRIQFEAGGLTFLGMHKKSSAPHQVTINNGNNNIDFVVNSNNNSKDPLLRCDASARGVGIGGIASPDESLHVGGNLKVAGNDPRIKIDGDVDSHPGVEFYENGTRKWIVYNDYTNDNLAFKTNSNIRMVIEQDGNVGIGTTDPTMALDIDSDSIRVRNTKTPSSASDTGDAGQICWDSNYLYICVATDTWKRVPIDPW